mmetsp:Transcript_114786/g.225206  ORF Transcript_114786/g.225206 Transcript_114786/m.225206 type:complete len:535 (-) Transcript_114786:203-1807(-)
MAQFARPGAGWASNASFQLARGRTLAIPMSVHAAARSKLVKAFADNGVTSGIVLMQGGDDQNQYDTDTELIFRQDSWFNYLFGVKESGIYGAICLSTGKTLLFIPRLDESYRIWCGEIHPPSKFRESYAVDEVLYVEDLPAWVSTTLSVEGADAMIHLMSGVNSDSGLEAKCADYNGLKAHRADGRVNTSILYNLLAHCRVIKSPAEQEVMRYVAMVASNAHVEMMRCASECTFEFDFEAKFLYEIYRKGGCRKCAYTCIGACGPNNAVLHYGHGAAPNDRELQPTDLALLDMGAEYHGYVSDITCSFPISGRFSPEQRAVYEGVLEAQRAVLKLMVPGTAWPECHKAAHREIIKALQGLGVLVNGTVEEMMAAHMAAVFMPHGLGHLIGCDTHDVGGYIPGTPARHPAPGLNKLRTARVLEADMVLTNEPGCYFIDALIDEALSDPSRAKYMDAAVLSRFRGFGGVRLEDVVVVRDPSLGGAESLSTCPRTVAEVEAVMAGGPWPPARDEAPELKRAWTKLAAGGLGMELITL